MNLLTSRREKKRREKENFKTKGLAISKTSKAQWEQALLKT